MTNKRGAAATSAENCALITDSILVCMQGGIIKFVTSGQMMTVGDMLEMLKALFEAMQKGGGGTGNDGKKPAFTGDDGSGGKKPAGSSVDNETFLEQAWPYFANGIATDSPCGIDAFNIPIDIIGADKISRWADDPSLADLPIAVKEARVLFHECPTIKDQDKLARMILNRWILGGYAYHTDTGETLPNTFENIIVSHGAFDIYAGYANNYFEQKFYSLERDALKELLQSSTSMGEMMPEHPSPFDPKYYVEAYGWINDDTAVELNKRKEHSEYLAKALSVAIGHAASSDGLPPTDPKVIDEVYSIFETYVPDRFPSTGVCNGNTIEINSRYITEQRSSTWDEERFFIQTASNENKYAMDVYKFDWKKGVYIE